MANLIKLPEQLSQHKFSSLLNFPFRQFKYFDKEEFKDLKYLRKLYLDGNQLSVVIDNLFQRQKSLQYLGMIVVIESAA